LTYNVKYVKNINYQYPLKKRYLSTNQLNKIVIFNKVIIERMPAITKKSRFMEGQKKKLPDYETR